MFRLISPFLVQYSALQTSAPAAAGAATATPWACAAEARPDSIPAPMPRPAALRMVRRASACSVSFDGFWVMASSIDLSVGLVVIVAIAQKYRAPVMHLRPRVIRLCCRQTYHTGVPDATGRRPEEIARTAP